ncbi:amidohydrolase family protein [Streptosporangium sp. NPDC051022]|uniref:amidohydrolase n=1 Tax=Streptosporangium sp. NPDC051022 TaxID=3155752 RepID=UPI00343E056F
MDGQLALVDGSVLTMAPEERTVQAVLISHGTVTAVGGTREILAAAPPSTEIVDLGGRTVVPGLIDAHTHVEFCALSRQHWLDVRGRSRSVTLERIGAVVAEHRRTGDWLVAQGTYGQDLPTREEIDAVAPDVPVLVRESMHRLTANTAALTRAGMTRGYTSPVGTRVEIGADGVPTGLVEEGYHLFPIPAPTVETMAEMLREELVHSFLRHGVTTIYELPATSTGMRAYQRLHRAGRLPARLSLNPTIAPGLNPLLGSIEQWTDFGLTTGFGDDRLWLGGAKVFLDGDDTASCDRAHLSKTPSEWGTATRHYAEIVDLLVRANSAGIQVWIHAIGDVVQELALDAVAEARRVTGRTDLRNRLEHVANLWSDAALLDRLAELEVIPVPTAAFMHSDPGTGVYAYRSLIERGLCPPGNSDTGGTQPFATNPWFGIAAMRARTNREGVPIAPEEAVDVLTGLRTYTTYAAAAGFRENRLGALAPGFAGDAVVLPADPRDMSDTELRDLQADLTVVGGEIVWNREDGLS